MPIYYHFSKCDFLRSQFGIHIKWSESLGLDTKKAVFTDILGFDEELLYVQTEIYCTIATIFSTKAPQTLL